jgi:predicted MFS family arabinose efflux permease
LSACFRELSPDRSPGSIADSMSRFRLLKITQTAFLLQALALAIVTMKGWIDLPMLIALETTLAFITAFDIPTRQAFVIELVGKKDLANAIAINSTTVNIARMIGPAIAGIIILGFDIGEVFFLNALTYVAVLVSLTLIRLEQRIPERGTQTLFSHMFDGLRYSWREQNIRRYLLLFFFMALFGMPYGTLMPVVAEARYGMGAGGLAWLTAASGFGATIGALMLSARRSTLGLSKYIFLTAAGFGASLLVFAAIGDFTLAVLFIPVCGFGMMMQMAGNNILLQTNVDEAQRGRVMSMLSMSFQLAIPLGSLWMGAVADRFGVSMPFFIGGTLCLIAVAFLYMTTVSTRKGN